MATRGRPRKDGPLTQPVATHLSPELLAKLKASAEANLRSVSAQINWLIIKGLEQEEKK